MTAMPRPVRRVRVMVALDWAQPYELMKTYGKEGQR